MNLNKVLFRILLVVQIFPLCVFGNTFAATYWVDDNGAAAWGNCSGVSPLLGVSACSLTTANINISGGDTVNLRVGIYNTQIKPINNGSLGNVVTYQAYNDEAVYLTGISKNAIELTNKDYITIDRIIVQDLGSANRMLNIGDSSYITVKNCIFNRDLLGSSPYASVYIYDSSYCNFSNNSYTTESADAEFNMLRLDRVSYSVFDAEDFTNSATHTPFDARDGVSGGSFNVMRNCTFSEEWHRHFEIWAAGDSKQTQSYWLLENNTFKDQNQGITPYSGSDGDMALNKISCDDVCIVRGNIFYNNDIPIEVNSLYSVVDNIYIYSNTIYNTNFGGDGQDRGGGPFAAFANSQGNTVTNVHFVNNIIRDYAGSPSNTKVDYAISLYVVELSDIDIRRNSISQSDSSTNKVIYQKTGDTLNTTITLANSHDDFMGNIDDVNPLMTDPANADFTLTPSSPVIDAGDWLTHINETTSGSQTNIIVDDAGFFYDGWDIPGEIGDVIMTEAGQSATITSINYTTNTITVSPAISIVNNEGIALGYSGDGPDIGAYEYRVDLNPPRSFILQK